MPLKLQHVGLLPIVSWPLYLVRLRWFLFWLRFSVRPLASRLPPLYVIDGAVVVVMEKTWFVGLRGSRCEEV